MAELRTITVCQAELCQNRGSKTVMHRLQTRWEELYKDKYPNLRIEAGDCSGDCEWGPVVTVNDSIILRHVDKEMAERLLENPDEMLGEGMHVLEQDRDTFDRIIGGDLF